VAATRAREKVVLVTSMPVAEVSNFTSSHRPPHFARDFLQAYLDYAEKVSRGDLELADRALLAFGAAKREAAEPTDQMNGQFREEVRNFVSSRGLNLVPGSEIDAFALDFAIEDPRTGLFGLGIECDSPRHPLLEAARAREIWRPRVLKAAVPHVHRVWSRAWYHDRGAEQQHLMGAIKAALKGRLQ
jgi:primosomal replication protein N''